MEFGCADECIPAPAESSTSSSVEGGRRHSTVRENDYRRQVGAMVAGDDPGIGRPVGPSEPVRTRKEPASMSTQIDVLETDVFGTIPAALIVLMTILAMLGVIANVATA
jgi:hypothetical protein